MCYIVSNQAESGYQYFGRVWDTVIGLPFPAHHWVGADSSQWRWGYVGKCLSKIETLDTLIGTRFFFIIRVCIDEFEIIVLIIINYCINICFLYQKISSRKKGLSAIMCPVFSMVLAAESTFNIESINKKKMNN